ncbi:hypothetical protein B566_EDAN011574 [Ephemera danica]|nr:hypothetical protein B566_EDAN011574 [Ephemera danica]
MTNNSRNGIFKYHKSDHSPNSSKTRLKEEAWDHVLPFPELPIWISVLLVASLATVCYIPSLDGDFVFDDSEAIINNEDIRPTSPLWNVFINDYWGTRLNHSGSHKSYRPFTVISFRLNYWLSGGLKPRGFRATNLLLHVAISVLSLKVFDLIFGGRCHKAAFLSSLLFAVHPVHCEAVAGIVGRADLLCTFLFFLSFICYAKAVNCEDLNRHLRQVVWLSTSHILTLVSMLCKEQGITVLGLCSAYDLILTWRKNWKGFLGSRGLLIRHVVLGTWGLVLLIARWFIMGGEVPTFQVVDNPASFADSFLTRAMSYNYIYALNTWLLLCPEWLCFDWAMNCIPLLTSPTDIRLLGALAFWTVLILLGVRLFLTPSTNSSRILGLGLVILVETFLPASNLLFRVGFVLAERVLYLPSAGFCALISLGLRQLSVAAPRCKNHFRCGVLLLLLVFTLRSSQRSLEWSSERLLFRSALLVCPLNAKVHYNVAKNAADTGDRQLALQEYKEALRLHPGYEQAMNNLGNLLRDAGHLKDAEMLLRGAVTLRPSFAAAWMNLGIVQAALGRHVDAEVSYRTALLCRPNYPDCYYNLGNLYLDQKRYDEAYDAWRNATSLKPSLVVAWSNMVIMLDSIGRWEQAESVGTEALTHLPLEAVMHFNLANTLGKMRQFERAEKHFQRAIAFESGSAKFHANLGVLYHRWKKYALAEGQYLHALQLDPDLQSAKDNLQMLYRTISRRKKSN